MSSGRQCTQHANGRPQACSLEHRDEALSVLYWLTRTLLQTNLVLLDDFFSKIPDKLRKI